MRRRTLLDRAESALFNTVLNVIGGPIISAIFVITLWCGAIYGIWWAFGPATFWQKLLCVVFEIPVGFVLGLGGVFLWAAIADGIEKVKRRRRRREEEENA